MERMGPPIESSRKNEIPVVLDEPGWKFQEYYMMWKTNFPRNCWNRNPEEEEQRQQQQPQPQLGQQRQQHPQSHTVLDVRQTPHRALPPRMHTMTTQAAASYPLYDGHCSTKLHTAPYDKSHEGFIAGYSVWNHAYW